MKGVDHRFRRQAAAVYGAMAVSTPLWWAWLNFDPSVRVHFFGGYGSGRLVELFLVPDFVAALLAAALACAAVLRGSAWSGMLAATVFGAQGYAALFSFGIAFQDPRAYPGAILMALSSGACLALAIRLNGSSILWGPFLFAVAPSDSVIRHWMRSLGQTFWMWTVFLILLPATILQIERILQVDSFRPMPTLQVAVAICIFVGGGTLGLSAARAMCAHGKGTPLPSRCPSKLVVRGPYRHIRNPMALGGIAQGAAIGIAFGSPGVVAYSLLGGFFWDVLARPLEEADLLARFGQSYETYRESVPCWRFRMTAAPEPATECE